MEAKYEGDLHHYNKIERKVLKYCLKGKVNEAGYLLLIGAVDMEKILRHPAAALWSAEVLYFLLKHNMSRHISEVLW